jgi:hypothetical protein
MTVTAGARCRGEQLRWRHAAPLPHGDGAVLPGPAGPPPGHDGCLAGLRRAVRSSLQALPAAIPGDVVDDLVLAVKEAATNAILY